MLPFLKLSKLLFFCMTLLFQLLLSYLCCQPTIILLQKSVFVDASAFLLAVHQTHINDSQLDMKSAVRLYQRSKSLLTQQYQRHSSMSKYCSFHRMKMQNIFLSTSFQTNYEHQSKAGEFFEENNFFEYQKAIEEIVSKKNVIRDFRKNEHDLGIVKEYLLDRRRALPKWDISEFILPKMSPEDEPHDNQEQYHGDTTEMMEKIQMSYTEQKLLNRREMYLNHTGLTISQHRLATILLAHLADHCAKLSQPKPLYLAWEKILEAGMTPLSRILSTYLFVLSLDHGSDTTKRDTAGEVAMFHDALYKPTEKTVALRVKNFVARGDAKSAEALLDRVANGSFDCLRYRTTSPILKLYCEKGDIVSAFRLYRRMRKEYRVKIDESTYSYFIASIAKCGYFRNDSRPIDGAESLGYKPAFGPKLLDALVSEMAQDVLDISEASVIVLRNGFANGFKENNLSLLEKYDHFEKVATLCDPRALVASRVEVDRDTCKCSATNASLRLIVLEECQRVHVHQTLLEMTRDKSIEYTSKLAALGRTTYDNMEQAELATQMLKDFSDWLEAREGRPYTAIVDGPNVAYFGWGRVNVHQLILMVNTLEKRGEHPLVIMPQKYTRQKFYLRQGKLQVLTEDELQLLERLKEKDQMYIVPSMCHDDMYWMLASVSNQTASTNGTSIHVPIDNKESRCPGLRPMVVSNDKMRDHKLDLLDERSFRRWCCSHVVNYNITEYIENMWDEREIEFHVADIISDEIQGNPCPDGGTAWHFPVSEWGRNDRFCLKLPTS